MEDQSQSVGSPRGPWIHEHGQGAPKGPGSTRSISLRRIGMKIMRLGDSGSEQPAVLVPSADGTDRYFSLLPLTADVDGAFLADGGLAKVRKALEAGELPVIEG